MIAILGTKQVGRVLRMELEATVWRASVQKNMTASCKLYTKAVKGFIQLRDGDTVTRIPLAYLTH